MRCATTTTMMTTARPGCADEPALVWSSALTSLEPGEGWHGRRGADWDEFGRPLRDDLVDDGDDDALDDGADYLLATDAVWGDGTAATPPVIG